jgi:Ca-activated chloride channel family protein
MSVPDDNATVVLLVDTSGSMRAADVEPTRLDAAAAAIRTFLDRLPKRFHVGLVEFSSEPEVLAEPTRDHQAVRDAVSYLSPDAGTAIGDGLAVATQLAESALARSGVHQRRDGKLPAAIVLLSDGATTTGIDPVGVAQLARSEHVPIYTVSLGTGEGVVPNPGPGPPIVVAPDPATLRRISEASGGRAFTAQDSGELSAIYRTLGSRLGQKKVRRETTAAFAVGGLVLLLGAAVSSVRWVGRLP